MKEIDMRCTNLGIEDNKYWITKRYVKVNGEGDVWQAEKIDESIWEKCETVNLRRREGSGV